MAGQPQPGARPCMKDGALTSAATFPQGGELMLAIADSPLPGTVKGGCPSTDRRRRAQRVRDYLAEVEGRFPTLDELSRVFGCSGRTLNNEFAAEFGDTIFDYMINRRLTMAHEAIRSSDVALKKVAATLGYTHVNNFSAAFRRKFGYSPGSLRRKDPVCAAPGRLELTE